MPSATLYPQAGSETEAIVEQPITTRDWRAVLALFLVQLHHAFGLVEYDHLALLRADCEERRRL